MQERTTRLNGQEFHLYEWGPADAPVILALHGFPEYGGAWSDLAGHLPDCRIIAPDQRGFGQSWAPQDVRDYATGKLVGDMAALIEQIGAPVIVLGHDWGAAVAYGLAMFHPHLVSRLIIMNGVHPAPFQRALATGGAQTAASQYIPWLRGDGAEDILAADDFAKLQALFAAHMDMSWLAGDRLAAALSSCEGTVILVASETGLGIVPENKLSRRFRDANGRLNQTVAALADEGFFVAAGIALRLKPPQ